MTAAEFVGWIEKNAARITEYSSGGDGSNGKANELDEAQKELNKYLIDK